MASKTNEEARTLHIDPRVSLSTVESVLNQYAAIYELVQVGDLDSKSAVVLLDILSAARSAIQELPPSREGSGSGPGRIAPEGKVVGFNPFGNQ